MRAMAHFTGIGFDSTKFTSINGSHFFCNAARVVEAAVENRLRERGHLAGITFDDVQITPLPPNPPSASVAASSPDNTLKSSGSVASRLAHCAGLPELLSRR